MHRAINRWMAGVVIAMAWASPAAAKPDLPLYKDPKAPLEARIEDLLKRMTLEEKVAQMLSIWDAKTEVFDAALELDPKKMVQTYPNAVVQFAPPSDATGPKSPRLVPGRDVRATVRLVNALQRFAMQHTRLGIPIMFHEEGLHGYAAVGATSFPQAIALASSWDPALVRAVNAVTAGGEPAPGGAEGRHPRGVAAVEGLQGENQARDLKPGKVFATLKHLTGHGQPESGTNVGPAPYSERTLREYFFPPFEQAISRTGVSAVMPSYNEIDGVPSHANGWLLDQVLRGEWGFKGAVVSDYYAIDDLMNVHHIALDREQAARRALEARIDAAVRRLLTLKFRAGLFEHPYADADQAVAITNNAEARALALKAAQRTLLLRKNDGKVPFPG